MSSSLLALLSDDLSSCAMSGCISLGAAWCLGYECWCFSNIRKDIMRISFKVPFWKKLGTSWIFLAESVGIMSLQTITQNEVLTLTNIATPQITTAAPLNKTIFLSIPCPRYCAQCSLVKKTRCDVLPKTITRRCRGKETRCQNQQNFPSTFLKAHFQQYKKAK